MRARTVLGSLAERMVLATAVAVAVVTAFAIVAERNVIGEVAVERAHMGVAALLALIGEGGEPDRLDGARVQSALERLKASAVIQERDAGRFISATVYDAAGRRLAGLEIQEAMAAIGGASAVPAPGPGEDTAYVFSRLNGIPIVSLTVPVLNGDGARLGSVDGVFAVSEGPVSEGRARIARRALVAIGTVLVTAAVIYPIIEQLVRRVQSAARRLLHANLESLAALGSAIAKKDSDTDAHNYRVTIYSARLGEAAGLDRAALCGLVKGAFLHDVGKIGIRDAILLKPGRLDEGEFAEMRKHVQYGLEILAQSAWLVDAGDVVGGHHEKFDGSGYPRGLSGEDIPVNARIFAIADVFDALTSRRPYKEAMSCGEALAILEKGRGGHFDPRLVDLFGGIAKSLYDEFGNREDERPRAALRALVARYFEADDVILLG